MERTELYTVRRLIRTEGKAAEDRLRGSYRGAQRAKLFDPLRKEKMRGHARLIARIRRLRQRLDESEAALRRYDLTVESNGTVGLLYSVQQEVDARASKLLMAERDEIAQLVAEAMLLDPEDIAARVKPAARLREILTRLQAIGKL